MPTANNHNISINIPSKSIRSILTWIVIIDIVVLAGTVLHHSKLVFQQQYNLRLILMEFNLELENVFAAWYSSMLLFLVALVAFICYLTDSRKQGSNWDKIINTGWLLIALAFATLSFDEMGSFHESIGESELFKKMATNGTSGWFVFYLLGGAVALFMAVFFLIKFRKQPKVLLFAILGFLLLVSVPFQEKFEIYSLRNAPDRSTWHRPGIFLLLEEGAEILAFFCFLLSFTYYAVSSSQKNTGITQEKGIKISLTFQKNFLIYLIAALVFLEVVMCVIHLNSWHLKIDDKGLPKNWFPSILSLTTFLICRYQYFKCNNVNKQLQKIYAFLAVTSVVTSIYFGANIYYFHQGLFDKLRYVIALLTAGTGTYVILHLREIWARVFVAGWVAMILISVLIEAPFESPFFGFTAFCFLLIAIYLHSKFGSEFVKKNEMAIVEQ